MLLQLNEARDLLGTITRPLQPTRVPLANARGRWLREDVIAEEDMPAFDRSAMDGYAIVANDPSERLQIIGQSQAGGAPPPRISRGECVRIFTGAGVPAGATQVLPQEEVECDGEWIVSPPRARAKIAHVRNRGEDAKRGDVLVRAGTRLGSGACALLASAGAVSPLVAERVRAVHITTGDELVDAASVPAPGQIRDSNSPLIAGLLAETGVDLVAQEHCKDSLHALVASVHSRSAGDCRMLLISGGASVGEFDFGAKALIESGYTIHFDRLNLRPGKPTIFASRANQIAFVIPGNPLAHFVVFHLLVSHAIRIFSGAPVSWPTAYLKPSGEVQLTSDRRETYWPARLRVQGGELCVEPLRWQSSGDMSALPFLNALIRIPPEVEPSAGGKVETLLLDSLHANSDVHPHE
ncbi:MAG TPA: molybdopterin molybdotransferase MoeA [Chthoniobacteraceae bacterium]|nr:molybdopterin molybdotransferase MoeA [Chthoniobacteraceae bacterium]